MRYRVIRDGKTINTIELDGEWIKPTPLVSVEVQVAGGGRGGWGGGGWQPPEGCTLEPVEDEQDGEPDLEALEALRLARLEAEREAEFERHVIEVMKGRYLAEFKPEPAPEPATPAWVDTAAEQEVKTDDGTQSGEPLPDPLARLVPGTVADQERKAWLRDRWQELTHKLMSPQVLGEMTEAERIEHQDLERYRGLFT